MSRYKILLHLIIFILLPLQTFANEGQRVYFQYFTERDGYSQSHITCVLQDAQGMIWIGSWEGLYSYDGHRFQRYKPELIDGKPAREYRIKRIVELPNHDILCLWPGHSFRFDRKNGTFHEYPDSKESADKHFRPSDELKAKVDSLPEVKGRKVTILFVDKQQGVWLFSEQGFCRLSFIQPKLEHKKLSQTPEEIVCALSRDKRGFEWTGNKNGIVTRYDRQLKSLRYLTPDGRLTDKYTCFGNNIYCIYEDYLGIIWLGSRLDGIFRLQPQNNDTYSILHITPDNSGLNCESIYDFADDHRGHLWVATKGGGLNVITTPHADKPHIINTTNGLNYKGVESEEMDVRRLLIHKNLLMVGTNGGLLVATLVDDVKDMYFHRYLHDPNNPSSIGDNKVRTIVKPQGSDHVFMGTYGGGLTKATLNGLTTENAAFKTYNMNNSNMPGEIVMGMSADSLGNIWGTTVSSLFRIDKQQDSISIYPITLLGEQYSFTETNPLILSDGQMLLGTTQGVLIFSPEKLMEHSYVPYIHTNVGDTIDLTPEDNDLFITMSALDYNHQERIIFAYRIDGVDDDWIYTHDRQIYYASLPPGEYTLHIKSTNSDGVWVNNERLFHINRHAAFNERPIAWMLYGILALLGIVATIQVIIYVRRLQKEMHNIELTYEEKLEYSSARLHETMQTLERHLLLRKDETVPASEELEVDAQQLELQRDAVFIEEVKKYVDDHFKDSDLSVDDIAAHMTISRCAFYLKMKQLFNVTPNNYLLMKRIEYAKQLLRKPGINVSEAAYSSGFSDPQYFSRVFRKTVGMPPSAYQEQG